ncbi:MAG TPA: exodeoxyribonuclease VII large subunit [Pricia sp.]|nr:exodeoxyribonuclease VII large subunit [Pricia sp.]
MPQNQNGKQIFSLLEVTQSIKRTVAKRYGSSFWVTAEMNKLNRYQRSGHCYPDLVEKKDGKVIAELRAILWKDDYDRINANFQRTLKEPLKDGIKILFSTSITFDPKYGLSLQILDIDPSFTLGDLEKEKQETIKRLQLEGIFGKNKQLQLPILPQRIAIISVESSKGYADFTNIFKSARDVWNYSFFQMLFPSLLQGDNAVRTLIAQLDRIQKVAHHFDVVAIIRGGGGDIGLSCYNHFALAKKIAEFPIPVITGIGHSTNETVTEMIAHENAITPTKLAEFIVQKFHDFSVPVQKAEEKIVDRCLRMIQDRKTEFTAAVKLFRSATANILVRNRNLVDRQVGSLLQQMTAQLARTNLLLQNTERNVTNLSPENVLKRGYSITRVNGTSVRSFGQVNIGDTVETLLYEGQISSQVMSKNKSEKNE